VFDSNTIHLVCFIRITVGRGDTNSAVKCRRHGRRGLRVRSRRVGLAPGRRLRDHQRRWHRPGTV